jgi:thymidylate kinase
VDAARLILVEGMIGSGKTTTALRIGDWLAGRAEDARVFREAAVNHPNQTRRPAIIIEATGTAKLAFVDLVSPRTWWVRTPGR